uniref:Dynein heavy chain linker domain-containing protein n=1 Tax=Stomoxys calcitrans TaxID=35570 RepID=A0A1I8Q927_STOCA
MSNTPPRGSLFAEGRRYSKSPLDMPVDYRRTTIYSQGIVKAERYSLDENVPITSKTCTPSNQEYDLYFKKLAIEKEKLPHFDYPIETERWLTLTGKNGKIHKFPFGAVLPKVHLEKRPRAKELPRDVAMERRRFLYSRVNLKEELQNEGVSCIELLPTEEQYYMLSENAFEHFLPLSFFDDTDFDGHSPKAWLKLGEVAEEQQRYPLPAKAFLPINQSLMEYEWQDAAISGYEGGSGKWSAMVLADERVYQVPKIQIMFLAENPWTFVKRLKLAVAARNKAETLLMMKSLVDCFLLLDIKKDKCYTNELVERLMAKVAIKEGVFYQELRLEICLLEEHLKACDELKQLVKLTPDVYAKFSENIIRSYLPKRFPPLTATKERSIIHQMEIQIAERKHSVLTYSLYYTQGGIIAMSHVATECLFIESMNLFVCNPTKAMPLSEFLTVQQQQSTQVANYLKQTWPTKIAFGITSVLRVVGGWLDINLHLWSVYEMCKIFRFLIQVKFRMQDSMQVLLETSIDHFVYLLSDPCLPFLSLADDYHWTSDFINSEFPYAKAIFSLVISVNENKEVIYSTQPEEFAPALKEVFKKSLEKTSGVRRIDAETMTNLQFAPDIFILTVETVEDLFVRCNDLLHQCYTKGIVPLRSYAHKYDRFVDFYLLQVPTYMSEYRAAQKPSMQVKLDVLEHKRCKEEMRAILPSSITIGPFLVIVEPMKQYMIRKRIEIVRLILAYYVERMYDINEALLERCQKIYNRIDARPQSIEHLFEIRDFASTIPELVEQLSGDIQVMWIEYEMLDGFFYNLPDHQFAMKWEAYAWPKNINDRLNSLWAEQELDIQEFKRLHLSECIDFKERLESLKDEIEQFSLKFDVKKVMEITVEIKKTWKTIQDFQKLGETLRYRQELFELEEFSLENLTNTIKDFLPYKNLWYACHDLVKLEEATIGNPLVNIELGDVGESIEAITNSLHKSLNEFNQKPDIQNVAYYFLHVMDEFLPKYNAIIDLKNDNWIYMHWQELGQRSGMDIKYSMAMNFQYCMRKGIMDHLELVHEISEKATNEADAIRKAQEEEERRKEEERQAILMRKAMMKCRRDIL